MAHDSNRPDGSDAKPHRSEHRTDHRRDERGLEERHHETSRRDVIRTWVILALLMVAFAVWFGIVYLLEPGIR
jgi:hypothetical protein